MGVLSKKAAERVATLGLALVVASSCLVLGCHRLRGTNTAHGGSGPFRSPTWVLVTIDSARIAPQMAGTETWDAPDQPSNVRQTAQGLAGLLSLAVPQAGPAVQALAALIPAPQANAIAVYPDPRIVVTYNESMTSRQVESPLLVDTLRPIWGYAFYVRIDTLRDTGLDLEVVDDDGDRRRDRVGSINVPKAILAQVATTGTTQSLEPSNAELEQLHVRIEPVTGGVASAAQTFTLPLQEGVVSTNVRVPQGASITVNVSGAGRVGEGGFMGMGCTPDVTPAGLPNGECRQHNLTGLPPLVESAHGSAVALIGTTPALHAVSLTNHDSTTPCVRFTSPTHGPLVFAVNDKSPDNNSGAFTFTMQVSPPAEGAQVGPVVETCR